MTRLARVVAVGVPHHVTQRGNARQFILGADADRKVYLDLLRQSIELHGLALVGYCLMSNHVHLIAIPGKVDVMGRCAEGHARPICCLLERRPSFQRPRLAGKILFLPVR
jgi:REP element-mobilizing transposase RayT